MNLINWIKLKNILEKKTYNEFIRNDFNINRYKIHKFLLKQKNILLQNYVNDKYLKSKYYNLVQNSFPYNLEKNILHLVLWINKDVIINVEEIIKLELKKINKENHIFLFFENPKHFRSIKKIKHFQVFVKLY